MKRFFDSHCHLSDDNTFFHPRKTGGAIALCRPEEWRSINSFSHESIRFFAGIHPWFADEYDHSVINELEVLLRDQQGVFIGETGLDAANKKKDLSAQLGFFRDQLKLAMEYDRPVCIHCVFAWEALIRVLKNLSWTSRPFYIHSFGGSLELAQQLIRRGGWISFSPKILGRNGSPAQKTARTISSMPLSRMLIETDQPYDSADNFEEFIQWCSKARGMSEDEFLDLMNMNSRNFFQNVSQTEVKVSDSEPAKQSPVWYDRTMRLIGRSAMDKLASSSVMIAGLGAVGGSALEAVVRAGVGRVILVDFDTFDVTNLNRQILASEKSIGKSKVKTAAERVGMINSACIVVAEERFITAENSDSLFRHKPDIIIDAIDSVNSKTAVIEAAWKRRVRCFSSMGAALRTDPCSVRSGPLDEIRNDRLARIIRKRLRRRGVPVDFPCVYSTEDQEKVKTGLFLNRADQGLEKLQGPDTQVSTGRARVILGSLPTIPAIFGNTLANMVIMELIS